MAHRALGPAAATSWLPMEATEAYVTASLAAARAAWAMGSGAAAVAGWVGPRVVEAVEEAGARAEVVWVARAA